MNKIQPLGQVRSIVASALNQTAKIRKNFESFFIETMFLILLITALSFKVEDIGI